MDIECFRNKQIAIAGGVFSLAGCFIVFLGEEAFSGSIIIFMGSILALMFAKNKIALIVATPISCILTLVAAILLSIAIPAGTMIAYIIFPIFLSTSLVIAAQILFYTKEHYDKRLDQIAKISILPISAAYLALSCFPKLDSWIAYLSLIPVGISTIFLYIKAYKLDIL